MTWQELPRDVMQAIASSLAPSDSLAARIACRSWAAAVPVPHISLKLCPCGPPQQLQQLLQALATSTSGSSGLRGVRACVVSLMSAGCDRPPAQPDTAAPAVAGHRPCSSKQQQQHAADQGPATCLGDAQAAPSAAPATAAGLLAQVLNALPGLDSLVVRVHKQQQSLCDPLASPWLSCSTGRPITYTGTQECHAVLLSLLALPQLQQQLASLTLSCDGAWPQHSQLAPALRQLRGLKYLQLHNCPLAALAQLPNLPELQRLAVSGRSLEPAPRSYSIRQRPLLPQLQRLQALQLRRLPLDVQQHEQEDIMAWQAQQRATAAGGSSSSYPGAAGHAAAGSCVDIAAAAPASSTAAVAAAAAVVQGRQTDVRTGAAQAGGVRDWRFKQQWVAHSILAQCPNLQQLEHDMLLGPAVLPQLLQVKGRQLGSSSCGSSSSSQPRQHNSWAAYASVGARCSSAGRRPGLQACSHCSQQLMPEQAAAHAVSAAAAVAVGS